MMDARWLRILPMLTLVGAFVFTNVYEDPANIFHNNSKEIAEALLDGNAVYLVSGNYDERAVKKHIIEKMPKHVDCLTIGTSLALGIRKTHVGTDSYYNLSTSWLNFYDVLAELGLLEINQVKVDRIIFCLDPFFFSEELYAKGSKNPDMQKYADYMLRKIEGEKLEFPKDDSFKHLELKFQQAFSLTYFQSALSFIQSNNSYMQSRKRWGIMDDKSKEFAHYLPDASLVYKASYRNRTEEDVIKESTSYGMNYAFQKGKHISEKSKKVFNVILQRLKKQGTEVEIFLCPLPPVLWDRIKSDPDTDQYYILDEIENYVIKMAHENGINIIGSYNPHLIGVTNSDFLDPRHMRHDRLEKYFNFKS